MVSVSVQTCLIVSFHQVISPSSVWWNSESEVGEFCAEVFNASAFLMDDLQVHLPLSLIVCFFPCLSASCTKLFFTLLIL